MSKWVIKSDLMFIKATTNDNLLQELQHNTISYSTHNSIIYSFDCILYITYHVKKKLQNRHKRNNLGPQVKCLCKYLTKYIGSTCLNVNHPEPYGTYRFCMKGVLGTKYANNTWIELRMSIMDHGFRTRVFASRMDWLLLLARLAAHLYLFPLGLICHLLSVFFALSVIFIHHLSSSFLWIQHWALTGCFN